jgi:hypothetical protein
MKNNCLSKKWAGHITLKNALVLLVLCMFFVRLHAQEIELGLPVGHTNYIRAQFSPDGKNIVTASGDGTAKI